MYVYVYMCGLKLLVASMYCESKGVILKGDLPIGVDHDSVDAW
jgi:4-alpha-glucanotransferase